MHIVYKIWDMGSSFLTLNISFHCPEPFCKLGVLEKRMRGMFRNCTPKVAD